MRVARFAIAASAILATTSIALADTGVMFSCTVAGEAPIKIYLDSTTTSGALQLGDRMGPDVSAKSGSFHTSFGNRQFSFVPNWGAGGGKVTVKGPGGTHTGPCTGP